MKKSLMTWIIGGVMLLSSCQSKDMNEYLKEVIAEMGKIESASYQTEVIAWQPGDTSALFKSIRYEEEYHNPADTTIGACYVTFSDEKFQGGYNGKIRLLIDHEEQQYMEDDFTARKLPFRPVAAPFFNHTRNILQYITETTDSIEVSMTDEDSCYHVKLIIHEEEQIEFFGKAHRITVNPITMEDPTSQYEVWIRKADKLPFKYHRKMSHDENQETCIRPTFNQLSLADFNLYKYIPEGYEFVEYRKGNNRSKALALEGKQAPTWTLNDLNDRPVSLQDIKSKVILLNFTGIGCGACQAAVPFLKSLKATYSTDDFELIGIESWSGKTSSRAIYARRKELNYPFLGADEKVLEDYQTGRAAPFFFLLDQNRVIRKVFRRYAEGRTDKEIEAAIQQLLK